MEVHQASVPTMQAAGGMHKRHIAHEDAIREGAAKGSTECAHVLDVVERGDTYKYTGLLHKESGGGRHVYYFAILDGAQKGSQQCQQLMDQWEPKWREITVPHHHVYQDAILDGANKGSQECKNVLDAWKHNRAYRFTGQRDTGSYHRHPYYFAIIDGAQKGSIVCRQLLDKWGIHQAESAQGSTV